MLQYNWFKLFEIYLAGLILALRPANEGQSYYVMIFLIGWVQV